MKTPDELIQIQVEEGSIPVGVDAEAYRMVFSALKKEVDFKLPDDFASRVASLAQAPAKKTDWDKIFLFGGLFAFAIAMIYAIAITKFTISAGAFLFLKDYSLLFALVIIVLISLQWLDKKLLRNIHSQG
ncbi:hypothetical protein WSM22_17060 [Cytophagales bacterium WSM2-2]|nr:hypothetical protein WSM22_17060 [Cytophagales bacterium WSM2-2]